LNKSQERKVNFLITNAHAQTFPGTLSSLKQVFHGRIVSTSPHENIICNFFSNKHYTIPKEESSLYLKNILTVCIKEKIHVIIPLSIEDRILFKKNEPVFEKEKVKIFSSSVESIQTAENKVSLFNICEKNGFKTPKHYVVNNYVELKEKASELGYPKKKLVVKPINSTGSRGLRIINKNADYKKKFSVMRADYTEITLSDLNHTIGKTFQPLILSEYLPGTEYTVDCLRYEKFNFAFPRTRVQVKNGLTTIGKMCKHDEIIRISKKIAELLELTTVFGFQFKLDVESVPVLIDCNPRIQGTTIMSTLAGANVVAMGVRILYGEKNITFNPDWSMTYQRFWSGIAEGKEKKMITF
jgi:carbamoyl-phosphate synthase large subunit